MIFKFKARGGPQAQADGAARAARVPALAEQVLPGETVRYRDL